MTKVFFTADFHLDHANIIRYCDRPFIHKGDISKKTNDWKSEQIKNLRRDEMNWKIVNNHNKIVGYNDLVYHLGDFCFKGNKNATYWESQLNGKVVHFMGNHDRNNGVKTYITHAIFEFGGLKIYATHIPPENNQVDTVESGIISLCDFIICGHIHNNWKHSLIEVWCGSRKVTKYCINVGVDVWNFEPISIHSILKYIAKIKKGY